MSKMLIHTRMILMIKQSLILKSVLEKQMTFFIEEK